MKPLKKQDKLILIDNAPSLQNEKYETALTIDAIVENEYNKNEEYIGHLAAIVESSEDAIISKSLDGTIRSWNKGSEKMFGYTAEEAIGKHISLIIPGEYVNDEKKILGKILNNEIIAHCQTVRRKKNGEQLCVSLTVSPLKDRSGNIIGVSKIARDITEQKKSEAEIVAQKMEREKQTKLIIANNELVLQNAEKEKRAAEWTIANKKLEFQNTEKEKKAADLITANIELTFQNEEKAKRAAELIIANKELEFQNKEKEKKAVALTIANKELVFQNEEKEKRADELAIAYEDLKISEEQLKEVNKELESFSYSVSHDLRAPLRAVNGYTRMLEENYVTQLDAEAIRLMKNIRNNARKMGQLIDDLLSFSRIGRKDLVKMDIGMDDIVINMCSELKNEQAGRNVEFDIRQLLPAQADSTAIKQVWQNLISNAIKYSRLKDKALIEIGSEIKGDEIIYYVKDNGDGFDMRYAGKLFSIFQRLHSDEDFEGSGIGLAIVQRIISKHGGRVWAEGKVNQGATFYFSLHKIIAK